VDHAEQLPLDIYLSSTSQRESIHSQGVPDIRKHRLSSSPSPTVVEPATLGIESFDHLLGSTLFLMTNTFHDLCHLGNLRGGFPDASASQFAHTAVLLQSLVGRSSAAFIFVSPVRATGFHGLTGRTDQYSGRLIKAKLICVEVLSGP
jgi:hypothetical protein